MYLDVVSRMYHQATLLYLNLLAASGYVNQSGHKQWCRNISHIKKHSALFTVARCDGFN